MSEREPLLTARELAEAIGLKPATVSTSGSAASFPATASAALSASPSTRFWRSAEKGRTPEEERQHPLTATRPET